MKRIVAYYKEARRELNLLYIAISAVAAGMAVLAAAIENQFLGCEAIFIMIACAASVFVPYLGTGLWVLEFILLWAFPSETEAYSPDDIRNIFGILAIIFHVAMPFLALFKARLRTREKDEVHEYFARKRFLRESVS